MKLGDLVGPVVGSSKSFNLWCDGLRAAVCFQSYGLPMFFAAGFAFLCFHRASPVVNSRPQSFPSFLQVGQLLEVFIGVELKGFTPADFQPFKKVFCSDIVVFKKKVHKPASPNHKKSFMFCFETIRPKHSSLFNGDLSGLDSTKVRRWGSHKWKNTWLFGLCTYLYIEFILACLVGSSTSHDEASSFWPGFLFFAWLNYCRSPLYTFVTRAMFLKFDSGPAQIRTPRSVHILSIGKQRIVLGFQGPIILTPTEFKRKRPNGSTAVGWCDEILISLFWEASFFFDDYYYVCWLLSLSWLWTWQVFNSSLDDYW